MPPANPKNAALGTAATDLGLGMPVGEDLLDEQARRKKLKEGKQTLPGAYGDTVMGNAAMELFTGFGAGQK